MSEKTAKIRGAILVKDEMKALEELELKSKIWLVLRDEITQEELIPQFTADNYHVRDLFLVLWGDVLN